jgi:hypothetical protein
MPAVYAGDAARLDDPVSASVWGIHPSARISPSAPVECAVTGADCQDLLAGGSEPQGGAATLTP